MQFNITVNSEGGLYTPRVLPSKGAGGEVGPEIAPAPALPRNSPMTMGKELILLGPQFPYKNRTWSHLSDL